MSLAALIAQDYAAASHVRWVQVFLLSVFPALLVLAMMALIAFRRPASAAALVGEARPLLEAERLCIFIQKTTQIDPHGKPGPQLSVLVQSIFEMDSVALFDADLHEVYQAGERIGEVDDLLQNVYIFETIRGDPEAGQIRRVLRMGSLPIGAMLLRGEAGALMASAIAAVVSITFDRYHAFANETRTESARRVEQLRTTVLDSLAHAYKTPLTAIQAAGSGLSAMGGLTPAQAGMVALIGEQADQLSQLTTRLLRTARLEASDLIPRFETVPVAPLIEDVVASLREQLAGLSVKIAMPRDDLSIRCDRGFLAALLTQYIDNAGKYADAGTTVTIQAAESASEVVFSVHSLGPLIPATDYERIFDRYYRCSAPANKAPGTGIGLSVAKRMAQAQGGHVWVTSDIKMGTSFFASLPTAPGGGAV